MVTPPSLSLLVFRLHPLDGSEDLNLLNQRLHTRLSIRNDVFLTQTMLNSNESDIFCIRFAMGGVRTTIADVEATWSIIKEEASIVLQSRDMS
jgi:hypothetical protein